MKKCILVTGGAGFIGSALSKQLAHHDLPFVAFDNLHPQVHKTGSRPERLSERAELFVGDVCRVEDWERFLGEYEPVIVVHLAAETGTGQSLTESVRHAEVNVVGTAQMLDAFSRRSIKPERILLTSSRAVYGEGAWRRRDGTVFYPGQRDAAMLERGEWDFESATAMPFDARTTEARPTSIYGASKLAQEHVIATWCRSFHVPHVILRLQNVYGPGQSLNNPYTGIVPLFSRMARSGKSIPLYEDGAMLRDFVFIDDVAAAIRLAIDEPGVVGRVLDIGTGQSITIGDLAGWVAARYGAPAPHVSAQFRNGDVRHAACEPAVARELLGWHPATMAPEGVQLLCDWLDSELQKESGVQP